MGNPKPLNPEQLYRRFDSTELPFETTAEIEDGPEIIGQQRAIASIRFGIGIGHKGYNLFALGPNGIGRQTTVSQFLNLRAATEPTPDDWCYVYNFEHPHKPHALRLPPGMANHFRADMKDLAEELATVLPATFSGDEYQLQKRALEEELRGTQTEVFDKLREEAKAHSIALIQTPGGFAFAPLKEGGEVITPDEFMRLDQEAQQKIEAEVGQLQEALQRAMEQMPNLHREMQKRFRELNERVVEFTIHPILNELRIKYGELEPIAKHLDSVQKDVIQNFDAFMQDDEEDGRHSISTALGLASADRKASLSRYEVNVMVDNGLTKGAPVVFLDQPRYQNLVGRIEHIAQMGALVTDFSLIKPGALHEANGGYLLIDALKLLVEPFGWDSLKLAIRKEEISIESMGQVYSMISTVSLEPDPIPLQIKVVLIGEPLLYYLLSNNDPEFNELFKVSADFEEDMERNPTNSLAYARVVAEVAKNEKLRPFGRDAVGRVIEHGSRMAEDSLKLSTHMQSLTDLLREADYWARESGHDVISREDVQQAIDNKKYRSGKVKDRIQQSILRGKVFIDVTGSVIGQVNGLSVYAMGSQSFGGPTRITARVRVGDGRVVDIEREVEMGGPIHSKGVLILSGYLGQQYAADKPLSLSATLVFEQSYGGVEGDSASSAELYALLSALAKTPIKQSLAVTGSVNQHGQIQPIGGVNEKIEGFYDICNARGLTGEQGVLIPSVNVDNLMLREDIVTAVANGKFNIYPVSTVDEGFSILSGLPAGEKDAEGQYPPESANGRVAARLAEFAEMRRTFNEKPSEADKALQDEVEPTDEDTVDPSSE